MNVAHIEDQSFIYGPGCRFVIWVQGCSLHCKGCWNKEMWSFKAKMEMSVPELFQRIQNEAPAIEGITLLGGEPLDQFEEVAELLAKCREIDISTMLFTGYEMAEITEKKMTSILGDTDILVTGRYDERNRTLNHQWIGSTNQKSHFLSDLHKDFKIEDSNYVEISIDDFGKIELLGFPDELLLDEIIVENQTISEAK